MISSISESYSMFADYSGIVYSNENLKILFDHPVKDFTPLMIPEFAENGQMRQRLGMASPDGMMRLFLMSDRIQFVIYSNRKEGFTSEENKQNTESAFEVLQGIYQAYKSILPQAYRLAFISSYVYHDVTNDKRNSFRDSFLCPLECYSKEKLLDDFSARYVGVCEIKIKDEAERVNLVTSIEHCVIPFISNSVEIDGYKIDIDINTWQGNKINRFDPSDYRKFIAETCTKRDEIKKVIFNGRG